MQLDLNNLIIWARPCETYHKVQTFKLYVRMIVGDAILLCNNQNRTYTRTSKLKAKEFKTTFEVAFFAPQKKYTEAFLHS